jgi:tetratricopeptide (TPR) repeat protein
MATFSRARRLRHQVFPRVTIQIPMPEGAAAPAIADSQNARWDRTEYKEALRSYEAGLRAMQEHKFNEAKPLFQKVLAGPSRELADRAHVYLNTCDQHADRAAAQCKTTEEIYDHAISLMNVGDYVGARECLEGLAAKDPKTVYVNYGLAALDCLTGRVEDSLRHLKEALGANPQLRYQARNDSDFQNLAEDPRFLELLHPEDPEPSPVEGPEVKGSEAT